MSEPGPKLTKLPANFVFTIPSDAAMVSAPLILTTCNRWIEIITACKDRKFNLLGTLAGAFFGAFLTALPSAIGDYSKQTQFALSLWMAVAGLTLLGAVLTGGAYWQSGSYEQGSLTTLIGEMREMSARYGTPSA